jgi:hypothetical protein
MGDSPSSVPHLIQIDPSDFKSLEPILGIMNEITHLHVRGGKKYFEKKEGNLNTDIGQEHHVSLVEILEDGFVLELPSKSCATGHRILLDIELPWLKDNRHFRFPLEVIDREKRDERIDSIFTRVQMIEKAPWEPFIEAMAQKHQMLMDLFANMKGAPR